MVGNLWLVRPKVLGFIFFSSSCLPVKRDSDLLKSSLSDAFGVIGIRKDDETNWTFSVGFPFTGGIYAPENAESKH